MHHKVDEKGILYLEQPRVPSLSLLISLFSLFLISLGTVSIFALQKPLSEQQLTSSKAAVQNGAVTISSDQNPGQFYIRQVNTVDLLVNTQGIQTRGITTIFNVVTSTTDGINVEVLNSSNLKPTSQEVQKTNDGYLVKVVTVPAGTAPFSSTTPTRFLRITFAPYQAGLFRLAFDQDYSHVYVTGSDQEVLGKIPQFDYSVLSDKGNSCNQSCSKNNDCAVNLRCYNNQCRSATNVSSSTCEISTIPTVRSCNQECANNAECQTGLTCFNNRCRAPENPDNGSCTGATVVTYNSIVKNCNVGCSSNKECAVNLRCYNGSCRLATNPSSMSCTPSTVASVSSIYADPLKGEKGEEIPVPSVKPTASASAKPFAWPTPVPVVKATPLPTPAYQTEVPTSTNSSPLAAFLNSLRLGSTSSSLSFPLIAVIAGVFLLIVALLLLLVRGRKTPAKPPLVSQTTMAPSTQAEKTLEQRIAELKANQTRQSANTVTTSSTVIKPETSKLETVSTTEMANKPATSVQSTEIQTTDKITPPPSTLVTQESSQPVVEAPHEDSSTMMQRLKSKGVMDKLPNPTDDK